MVNEGDKSNMHKNRLTQRVAEQTAYVSHELYVFQSMSFCQTLMTTLLRQTKQFLLILNVVFICQS
jgi:hypothetical protein